MLFHVLHLRVDLCELKLKSYIIKLFLFRLGCQRLLTSGQGASALDGAELIGQLVQQNPEIMITPGGGITENNLVSFKNLDFYQTSYIMDLNQQQITIG